MTMGVSGWLSSSLLALTLFQGPSPEEVPVSDMRYERQLHLTKTGASCAPLDASVFAHSSAALKDLRLLSEGREVPYAIAINQSAQAEVEPATILNLTETAHSAEFDLAMPPRAYTQLQLRLDGKDFVANATLTGRNDLSGAPGTPLGTFTVFDLSSQALARNTTISMQESTFPFLHIILRGRGLQLRGVEVPPAREEQTLFVTVAETRELTQQRDETVAHFHIPAHVPVEQATITIEPGFRGDFSREIRVTASSENCCTPNEEVTGTILRVRRGAIQIERDSVTASLGANLQTDAVVDVAIRNGDKPVLPIRSVGLAMRQRMICFDAAGPTTMLYGDLKLTAPAFQYQTLGKSNRVIFGPELLNPSFRPRGDPRPWNPRHPARLWTGILIAFGFGGIVSRGLWHRRRVHTKMH